MTADRPFFKHTAVELEREAKKHWDSIAGLKTILQELARRTTARAQRVERDVAQRIVALGGTVDQSGPRHQDPAGKARPPGQDAGLAEMTMRAVRAEQRVRELEARVRIAEADVASMRSSTDAPNQALYRAVGLDSSCPEFLLRAAQRAYRKEYHPDALSDRPRDEQMAAQERFKEYEAMFERIERLRR